MSKFKPRMARAVSCQMQGPADKKGVDGSIGRFSIDAAGPTPSARPIRNITGRHPTITERAHLPMARVIIMAMGITKL